MCEESLDKRQPVLERFQRRIVYLQNSRAPTVLLLLYVIDDLIGVCDRLGDEASNAGKEDSEIILSRLLAELKFEFEHDLTDDYLKMAQLFDPRVCHRVGSMIEVDRLQALAFKTFQTPQSRAAIIDVDDVFGIPNENPNDHSAEISAFKLAMKKVKIKVTAQNGEEKYEYHGGVGRQQDIDIFRFYRGIKGTIPKLEAIIRKVLGNAATTATNDRSFNIAGNVLNMRRCRLDPLRAEKLILSAFRYKVKLAADRKSPILPSFCVIEEEHIYDDNEIEQIQRDEEEAAAWEAFFEESEVGDA